MTLPLWHVTTPLARAVDVRPEDLLSRHQRRPGQPTQAHAEQSGRVAVPASSTHKVGTNKVSSTQSDALARLDTGDLRWLGAADKARRVLGKPIPILIQGESGAGKEFFARATHDSGPRRDGPFVAINCAAEPENRIEAEFS